MLNFLKLLILSSAFFSWNGFAATTSEGVTSTVSTPYAVDAFQLTCGPGTVDAFIKNISSNVPMKLGVKGPGGVSAVLLSDGSYVNLHGGPGVYHMVFEAVTPVASMSATVQYQYECLTYTGGGRASESNLRIYNGKVTNTISPVVSSGLYGYIAVSTSSSPLLKRYVFRSDAVDGPFVMVGEIPSGQTVFNDTSVLGGTYYYRIGSTYEPAGFPFSVDVRNATAFGPVVSGSAVAIVAAPTGLTASTTALDHVNLTWGAVSGATYKVYRDSSAGGAFSTVLATSGTTSFADTTTTNGTSYWYKVSAVTNGNEGAKSSVVTGQSVGLPATPAGLSASTTVLDQVNLTWGAVSGATYKVYRDSIAGGAFSTVLATSGTTSFADTTTTNGTSYWYKVSAVTNGNEGAKSAAVTGQSVGLPATPAGLTASTTALDQVNLTWTAVSGASYKVYRDSSAGGAFSTVLATSGTTSFADTTTTNGTSYWYKVSAVTNGNEGAKSAAVTGQSVGLPATPAGLTASTTALDQVNLTWGAVSGASYKVYRATSSTGPFTTPISSPTGTSFTDTTTVNGTSYWYTVSAVTNGNEGAQSVSVTGQSVALPVAPTGLTASTTSLDQVDLAWDVIPDASYKVYRASSSAGPFTTPIASPTGTSFADTTSVNGTPYWYTISAVTNGNEGAQSGAVTGESIGLPAAPVGLTASNNQVDKIDLSWTSVAGAQYLIYRADTSTGPFNVLGSVTTENYSDTSIISGIAYWYTISAVTYDNEGAQSTPASGQALAMPAIPAGLTATQGTVIERVSLTWSVVSAVTGYGIYRDGAQVGVTSDLFYDDVLIGDILVHNYTISALSSGLESAQSEWVSGFAKAQPTGGVVDGTTPPPATPQYKIVVKTPLH